MVSAESVDQAGPGCSLLRAFGLQPRYRNVDVAPMELGDSLLQNQGPGESTTITPLASITTSQLGRFIAAIASVSLARKYLALIKLIGAPSANTRTPGSCLPASPSASVHQIVAPEPAPARCNVVGR